MIEPAKERIDDKLAELETRLKAVLPNTRLIEIGLVPPEERKKPELLQGVLNIVSVGEGDYHHARGMEAKEGTLGTFLIGNMRVEEGPDTEATRKDLQQKEIDFIEEIKAFVRNPGITGMSIRLNNIVQSRLLEFPHGWFIAYVDLLPPRANTH